MTKPLRRALFGPKPQVFFISADQKALAFLAQIIFTIPIRHRWQPAIHFGNVRNRLCHKILMFCWLQRQSQTGKCRNFAPPQPSGIDHPVGLNIPLRRLHDPAAIQLLFCRCHRGKSINLSAFLTCPRRIGIGDPGWIHITAVGLPHDAANAVIIDQWVQTFSFVPADFVKIHAIQLGLGRLQPQLMFTRFGLRKIQGPRLENPASLPGFCLEFLVQVHRIVLNSADICAVMQAMNVCSRMPCRS